MLIAAAETAFLRIPAVRIQALAADGSRRCVLSAPHPSLRRPCSTPSCWRVARPDWRRHTAGTLPIDGSDPSVTVASAVLTFILFIHAEAIPKTYAVRHPDKVALALAFPLAAIETVLRPPVRVLVAVADLQMPGKTVVASPTVTEDELRMLAARRT